MDVDGSQIVIGKNDKKVFNVHGSDLQLIASLMFSCIIQWEAGIDEKMKARYVELVAPRQGACRSSRVSFPFADNGATYSAYAKVEIS